jgi:hypothetical protein
MEEVEGGDSATVPELRKEYETVVGKNPSPVWGAAKLRQKIAEKQASEKPKPVPPAAAPEPPPAPLPGVRVMLLGDHVYLPIDPTQPGWETSDTTKRYDGETDGRRTKLDVHPTLAAFLQERKQAEILD